MPSDQLSVKGLKVSYGAARVISNVNLDVASGEIVGFVGANGAGKTTTLRAISGIVPRGAGEVTVNGKALAAAPQHMAIAGVAHVPEGRGLVGSLTVEENLRLAVIAIDRRYRSADFDYAVDVFPRLKDLAGRRAGLLSGGEQQMVAIARGLLVRPRFLMIDELSLGLAPKIVHDLLTTLQSVSASESMGVLLVDQNLRALARVCHKIYSLSHGVSTLQDATSEENFRSVYFG